MKSLFSIIMLLFFLLGYGQEDLRIVIQKIGGKRKVEMKLPLKCRIYKCFQEKRYGKIIDYWQDTILFEFKDYDTAEVSRIMKLDTLTKRERYDLADTLVEHSKVLEKIPMDSLERITVLSGNHNLGRELIIVGGAGLFIASGALLINDLQTNVGGGFSGTNWIQLGVALTGGAIMAIFIKRDFYMHKWRFVPPD